VAFNLMLLRKLTEVLRVSWYSYLHRLMHNMGRVKNIVIRASGFSTKKHDLNHISWQNKCSVRYFKMCYDLCNTNFILQSSSPSFVVTAAMFQKRYRYV